MTSVRFWWTNGGGEAWGLENVWWLERGKQLGRKYINCERVAVEGNGRLLAWRGGRPAKTVKSAAKIIRWAIR